MFYGSKSFLFLRNDSGKFNTNVPWPEVSNRFSPAGLLLLLRFLIWLSFYNQPAPLFSSFLFILRWVSRIILIPLPPVTKFRTPFIISLLPRAPIPRISRIVEYFWCFFAGNQGKLMIFFPFFIPGWLGAMSLALSLFISPLTVAVCRRKSTR